MRRWHCSSVQQARAGREESSVGRCCRGQVRGCRVGWTTPVEIAISGRWLTGQGLWTGGASDSGESRMTFRLLAEAMGWAFRLFIAKGRALPWGWESGLGQGQSL